jgi:hypothetical protein
MSYQRMNGADFAATAAGDCLIRCEVLGDQIEFWFGDVGSGLHLYFDPAGYHKFAQVESDMVERLRTVPDRTSISFVVGDDDPDAHGSHTDVGTGSQATRATQGRIDLDAYATIGRDCSMMCKVIDAPEALIELEHGTGSLNLVVSEDGLTRLLELLGAALADMRTAAHPATLRA